MRERIFSIQLVFLYFVFGLSFIFQFLGLQPIVEYFKNTNDSIYVSFNYPLVLSRFIDLFLILVLLFFTSLIIHKLNIGRIDYKNLILIYMILYVCVKFAENLLYFINLWAKIDYNFFEVLSPGSIINLVISAFIYLTILIFTLLKQENFRYYLVGVEVIVLIVLNMIFPVYYSKYSIGIVPLRITYILFIIFSLSVNFSQSYRNKRLKNEVN